MRLSDLVGGAAHVCGPETTIEDAAAAMAAAGHGSLGVVEGSALVGVVTERDLVRALGAGHGAGDLVRRWMTPDPDVFDPATDVFEAAQWLLESGYRHLPVVSEDGRLLGVVSVTDVLAGVLDSIEEDLDEEPDTEPVSDEPGNGQSG
jgi:CBS domain-containing protein